MGVNNLPGFNLDISKGIEYTPIGINPAPKAQAKIPTIKIGGFDTADPLDLFSENQTLAKAEDSSITSNKPDWIYAGSTDPLGIFAEDAEAGNLGGTQNLQDIDMKQVASVMSMIAKFM